MAVAVSKHKGGAFLSASEAEGALALWSTRQFDTCDIARMLNVREDAVWRTIHAARDIARGLALPS